MNNNRSEEMFSEKFKNVDQNKWQEFSFAAENEIAKRFQENETLYEIYEFARKQRYFIAEQLGHTPREDFGTVRDFSSSSVDFYKPNVIAGSKQDSSKLFDDMSNIIKEQSTVFNCTVIDELFVVANIQFNTDFKPTYSYEYNDANSAVLYVYAIDDPTKPENKYQTALENKNILVIQYVWPEVNEEIYKEKLIGLQPLLNEIKEAENKSEDALYKIGLLVYDLSKFIPLVRGTASINGWITRSIAHEKGIELGPLRIRDLPFDIYAQIQTNREQYAKDFVKSLGPANLIRKTSFKSQFFDTNKSPSLEKEPRKQDKPSERTHKL